MGIKDALSEHSGLVKTVGGHEDAFVSASTELTGQAMSLSQSSRRGNCSLSYPFQSSRARTSPSHTHS